MKNLAFKFLILLATPLLITSCRSPQETGSIESSPVSETHPMGQASVVDDVSDANILQVAVSSGAHSTLVAAVQAAQIEHVLVNAGPLMVIGLGIPFLAYGLFTSSEIVNFILLLISGTFLTFIFVALAICIALFNKNKIKGFGYAILMWLFFAVIYDGIVLISMMVFEDYPLDRFALIASFLNPIDLSRILILLKLDISALLGYTGALFQQFFGTSSGLIVSMGLMLTWTIIPCGILIRKASRNDF